MRVYLPATPDDLRALASGTWPGEHIGFAVTAAVRQELSDLGDEDVEFAVTSAAAELSFNSGARRRVVVVVEVPHAGEGGEVGQVRVHDISLHDVQAFLVDPADHEGDPYDASGLGWYATQELDDLVRSPA